MWQPRKKHTNELRKLTNRAARSDAKRKVQKESRRRNRR